ncbi:hypothetical protein I4U23_006502 [Adineta vaga]|nr:hypothetical protein I4U23_006502 [Adineta vaga]
MSSSIMLVSIILLGFLSPVILSKDLKKVYQDQIEKEFFASNVYLTFAYKLARQGIYHGFANFFFESAEEEREHGKKFIDFYNVRNQDLALQSITINKTIGKIADLGAMLKGAKLLEDDVFTNMRELRNYASTAGHYETVHFIEKVMLEEQTTAVKQMHDIVQRLDRNKQNPTILLQMMDQDLRKKQVKKP